MSAVIAAVTFQLWQVITLILLCCASLIVSLYCLLFMVPVKRFWEHIESLGGGVEGIENHVEGVADELTQRLQSIERRTKELIEENVATLRQAMKERTITLQARIREAALRAQEASKGLHEIRQSLGPLRNTLQEQSDNNSRLSKSVDSLAERVEQLQRDFESLDVELRESLQQLASDSYQRLEGTVLSALDAIQNQILRGVERPHPVAETPPVERLILRQEPPSEDSRRGKTRKIISAGPLFSSVEKTQDRPEEPGEKPPSTEDDAQEETGPGKTNGSE